MNTRDMIPRVTVRDPDDALIILAGLKLWGMAMMEDYAQQARMPGADAFRLSVLQIAETRELCELIDAIAVPFTPDDGADVVAEMKNATPKEK